MTGAPELGSFAWLGRIPAASYVAADRERPVPGRADAWAAIATDPAVSIGKGFDPPESLLRSLRDRGWPLLRRSTGGSAVLHAPGDLLWSLVLPRPHPWVGRDFARAYGRLGAAVAEALGAAGLPVAWTPSAGLSEVFCLLGPRGLALTSGDRTVGGAAQYLPREHLLHHGTVVARPDRAALAELFGTPPATLRRFHAGVGELAPGIDLERVGRDALARWAAALAAVA